MNSHPQSRNLEGVVPWPAERANRYHRDGLWLGQSLWERFEQSVVEHQDREAFIDGGERLTYSELRDQAREWAGAFSRAGLRDRDCVVLQLPNGVELLAQFLALLALGVVPVLALPGHRYLELSAFVRRSKAVALIVTREAASDYVRCESAHQREPEPTLRQILVREGGGPSDSRCNVLSRTSAWRHEGGHLPLATATSGDVALLQLSGGSTGIPKLIARTHDDYLYSVLQSARVCRLTSATRLLLVLPMMHNFALSSPGVLGVLFSGGTIVNCPSTHPAHVFHLLRGERITLLAIVPSLLGQWLPHAHKYLGGARLHQLTLQVGGAKLERSAARRALDELGCQLQQVYGMAEGLVNYTRLDDPVDVVISTQGRPLSEFDEIRVVSPENPEGVALEAGEVGELQTRGPYTIPGYYCDPEHNRTAFTSDGFYRTSDLVRITDCGNIEVVGRVGERILRAGEKVDPLQVEAAMKQCPGVREPAVVGLPDSVLGQCIAAFVVPMSCGEAPTLMAVRAHLRQLGLAEFKLPDRLFVVSELPLTQVGKLDKRALVSMHVARTQEPHFKQSSNPEANT